MLKQEFLLELEKGLYGLPRKDLDERLSFYSEMIDDLIEDGLTQQEAVDKLGGVENVISSIVTDYPLRKIVIEKAKPKRALSGWEITLLIMGFPLWLSLIICLFAVGIAIFASIWAIAVVLFAVNLALLIGSIGGVAGAIIFLCKGYVATGLAIFGCCLVLAGISILLFFANMYIVKGLIALTKKLVISIKLSLVRRQAK